MPPSIRQSQSPTTVVKPRRPRRRLKKKEEEQQQQQQQAQEPAAVVTTTTTQDEAAFDTTTNAMTTSPYNTTNMMGGGMYGMGGGMGGMSSMYGGGMGGGMYGGGMGGGMYGGGGPLSNLNQFLFGIQNVVFSLGQAVQIIGMNTHAIQQLLETATTMLDRAVTTYQEMRILETKSNALESEEDTKRRRRLRALRWTMVMAATVVAYKLMRLAFVGSSTKRRRKRPIGMTATAAAGQQASPSFAGGLF